jgi:hypothetical protein
MTQMGGRGERGWGCGQAHHTGQKIKMWINKSEFWEPTYQPKIRNIST